MNSGMNGEEAELSCHIPHVHMKTIHTIDTHTHTSEDDSPTHALPTHYHSRAYGYKHNALVLKQLINEYFDSNNPQTISIIY